jgi:hypothetical protein
MVVETRAIENTVRLSSHKLSEGSICDLVVGKRSSMGGPREEICGSSA